MKYFLLLAVIHITCSIANYTDCGYMDENGTVWDLSPLMNDTTTVYYVLPTDNTQSTTFYMNFCEDVDELPPDCGLRNSKVCTAGTDVNCQSVATRTAGTLTHAYVRFADGTCRATAGGSTETFFNDTDLIDFSTELVNGTQRALVMTYNYGDFCNITGSSANRQLKVYLLCNENITEIDQQVKILQAASHADGGCLSEIQIESVYGCPVEEPSLSTTEEPTLNTTEEVALNTTEEAALNTTEEVIESTAMETMETTELDINETDTSTTAAPYSLSGKWCKYDMDDNEVFGIMIGVNTDCTQVTFTMYSPANDSWFAFGIGGDYEHESSEEIEASSGDSHEGETSLSESEVMNGYAIISTGTAVNGTFESTLQAGMVPKSQVVAGGENNLDCDETEENGVRYVVCTRDFETGDDVGDDFNEFIAGVNAIIYAYGPIASNGVLMQHHENTRGYGEAHEAFIYMEQEGSLCGYAEEWEQQNAASGASETDETWMIVGIIFIILFAIALGVVIWLCWKLKEAEPQQGGKAGYQPTSAQDED